jgi:hypothetical protein
VKQGLFSFIIVDNINNKIKMIEDYWYLAKSAGYEVYVFETSETDPKVGTLSFNNVNFTIRLIFMRCF